MRRTQDQTASQNKDSCKFCAMMAPFASGMVPLYPQPVPEGKGGCVSDSPTSLSAGEIREECGYGKSGHYTDRTSASGPDLVSYFTAKTARLYLDKKTVEERKKVVITKRFLQPPILK
ncbi:hypothetical protein EDD11_006563 [Mortierella claussenii]|nr:hypothetical protein EDD11_006563 [Mortierella claussenii]